jgi:hypothetical protein
MVVIPYLTRQPSASLRHLESGTTNMVQGSYLSNEIMGSKVDDIEIIETLHSIEQGRKRKSTCYTMKHRVKAVRAATESELIVDQALNSLAVT